MKGKQMIQHHSVKKATLRQPRQSHTLLLVAFITLTLMTIPLPYAQAVIIDYELTAVSPTIANGLNAELSGTFRFNNDPSATMPITSLSLVLTNSPLPSNPPFPLKFSTANISNANAQDFTLVIPRPTIMGATIEVIVETFGGTLGGTPPPTIVEYSFDEDINFFEGVSNVTVMNTGGPGPTVPEPGTALLLATGLLGLAGYRWKQRHRVQAKGDV